MPIAKFLMVVAVVIALAGLTVVLGFGVSSQLDGALMVGGGSIAALIIALIARRA